MEWDDLNFFSPWADTKKSSNRLPHWNQKAATYFVTWRLADSIPAIRIDQWEAERKEWMRKNPRPWKSETENEYHRLFSSRIDDWLDRNEGSCLLRSNENAKIVGDALQFFEGERTAMISFVVMPNHVHTLFSISPDWTIEQVVHSWKSFTATKINQGEGLGGPLWQKDYFDRMVRDSTHFGNCVRYIRRNPLKGKLREGEYLLFECDLAKEV